MGMEGTSFGETISADESTLTKSVGTISVKNDGITNVKILNGEIESSKLSVDNKNTEGINAYAQQILYQVKFLSTTTTLSPTSGKRIVMYKASNAAGTYFPNITVDAGTASHQAQANQNPLATIYGSNDAINSAYSFRVIIPVAGAYSLRFNYVTNGGFGIMTVKVDTVTVGTQDGYLVSTTFNNVATISLGTLTAGAHTVQMIQASKHASSIGYGFQLSELLIEES